MFSTSRRLHALVAAGLTLSATAALLVGSVPDAASDDDAGRLATVAELAPDSTLDPRILGLDFRGAGWDRAVDRLDDALFGRMESARDRDRTAALLTTLRADRLDVRSSRSGYETERDALIADLEAVEVVLRARAVDLFVRHGEDDLDAFDSVAADTDKERGRALAREVTGVNVSQRNELETAIDDLESRIGSLAARNRELSVQIAATESTLVELEARLAYFEEEVPAATASVVRVRREASIAGLDMSVTALDAYLNAARLLTAAEPACNAEWWMLAGVARIESFHGAIGRRTLQADGRPSVPIIGIALDGRPGVREIVDTDDGRHDGDTVYDRAVGPLQFIPETWSRRGRDGSGDGRVDPQNIYDAAFSTGRYLCALGGDLSSSAALRSAYFGYNTSTEYVDAVHGHARRYGAFELPVVENRVDNPPPAGD